jgi:NhaC family Na+:H+ antiporter|tara:strand:+ start:258 stop:908 length:651 start_codon:yes stop_codon:yes gene_type:complete
MIAASIVAILIAAGLQDRTFAEIFNSIQYGYSGESGVAAIDTLLNRGGIQSMMWTMSLAFIALALGGVLDGLGVMHTLTRRLIGGIKSTMQLVGSTIATGIVTNMSMGENYLTIIFTSHIFKESFHKMGYQRRMLSRSVEEGATLTAGLIPWTTTGAFFSAALGVSTAQYAPWVLLSLINIPLSLLMAAVGIAIFRRADSVQIKENKRLPVDAQES